MLIYLAGPINGDGVRSVEQNCALATEVYLDLVALGYSVYCPHLGHPCNDDRITEGEWLRLGLHFLQYATHVLMLPEWQNSRGARAEHMYAQQLGKEIFYDEHELKQRCPVRPRAVNLPT